MPASKDTVEPRSDSPLITTCYKVPVSGYDTPLEIEADPETGNVYITPPHVSGESIEAINLTDNEAAFALQALARSTGHGEI